MKTVTSKRKDIPVFLDHERFLKSIKINQKNNCWEWTGVTDIGGYGVFSIFSNGKQQSYRSHRVSYSLFENIDTSLVLDHICKNRKCANPEHLRQVTSKVNTLENSISPAFKNSQKTHCPKGHEYLGDNLIVRNNMRFCRECRKIVMKRCNDRRPTLKEKLFGDK